MPHLLLLHLLLCKSCALRHLPLPGLAVTSATVVIYGAPIVDPVMLIGKMQGVVPICTALFGELLWLVQSARCWQRLLVLRWGKASSWTTFYELYPMCLACPATQNGWLLWVNHFDHILYCCTMPAAGRSHVSWPSDCLAFATRMPLLRTPATNRPDVGDADDQHRRQRGGTCQRLCQRSSQCRVLQHRRPRHCPVGHCNHALETGEPGLWLCPPFSSHVLH